MLAGRSVSTQRSALSVLSSQRAALKVTATNPTVAQHPTPAVDKSIHQVLAPTGALRAAINYGNPVLAQKGADGHPRGVSAALANALAAELRVPVTWVTFDGAGKVVDAVKQRAWDVAFLAIDPLRAREIAFTSPYVIIEGTYMVPQGSTLNRVDDFDREDITVAVGKGAAYDLYLSRALKKAKLVRAPTSAAAIDLYLTGATTACAGVRQPLNAAAKAHPGHRVLTGRFTAIEQAMALPRQPDGTTTTAAQVATAFNFVQRFIETAKANGTVARELAESGQEATVAPAAEVPVGAPSVFLQSKL